MSDPVLDQTHPRAALNFRSGLIQVNTCLQRGLEASAKGSPLVAALGDAVLGQGKRLRPLLMAAAYAYAAGTAMPPNLLPVACAFELLHAASLIYDDLPCMDNAEERRGAAALHVRHGEAPALLAAVSLQNMAYQWVADADGLAAPTRIGIMRLMAQTVGPRGLAAGQYHDLNGNPAETRHLKTGLLFRAAAEAGALCADAEAAVVEAVIGYANRLGTAFQILDDLLDHDAPEGELRLRGELRRLLEEAMAALDPARAAPLQAFIALVFGSGGA